MIRLLGEGEARKLTLHKMFGDPKNAKFIATRDGGSKDHRNLIQSLKVYHSNDNSLIKAIAKAAKIKLRMRHCAHAVHLLNEDNIDMINQHKDETLNAIKTALGIQDKKIEVIKPDKPLNQEALDKSGKTIYIRYLGDDKYEHVDPN